MRVNPQAGTIWRILDRARRRPETPIVLCIDVEPDPLVFDPANPPSWSGFERFLEILPALRWRLSQATGKAAAFTWCLRMDPQIAKAWGSPGWAAEKYGNELAELTREGDELGLHTHVWRWESDERRWIADYEDPSWGQHCLAMALDAFESCLGRVCAVHRGGGHFLSGAMLSTLEERQVNIDLTVEPGHGPEGATERVPARGLTPDFRGLPSWPYRSTPEKFPAFDPAARNGPLLVPMASARRRRPPFYRTPLLLQESPKVFMQRLSATLLGRAPILGFSLRSDDVLGRHWETIAENIQQIARRDRASFITASGAVQTQAESVAHRAS